MDRDHYLNPQVFNPSRFVREKSVVMLDDRFLTIGYYKNGCPRRFFASHFMKVMLACVQELRAGEYEAGAEDHDDYEIWISEGDGCDSNAETKAITRPVCSVGHQLDVHEPGEFHAGLR
jgi:hypothetical protein